MISGSRTLVICILYVTERQDSRDCTTLIRALSWVGSLHRGAPLANVLPSQPPRARFNRNRDGVFLNLVTSQLNINWCGYVLDTEATRTSSDSRYGIYKDHYPHGCDDVHFGNCSHVFLRNIPLPYLLPMSETEESIQSGLCRAQTTVYDTQILHTRKHTVSEHGCFRPQVMGGRHLLCLVP
jgi:hypothetical protein